MRWGVAGTTTGRGWPFSPIKRWSGLPTAQPPGQGRPSGLSSAFDRRPNRNCSVYDSTFKNERKKKRNLAQPNLVYFFNFFHRFAFFPSLSHELPRAAQIGRLAIILERAKTSFWLHQKLQKNYHLVGETIKPSDLFNFSGRVRFSLLSTSLCFAFPPVKLWGTEKVQKCTKSNISSYFCNSSECGRQIWREKYRKAPTLEDIWSILFQLWADLTQSDFYCNCASFRKYLARRLQDRRRRGVKTTSCWLFSFILFHTSHYVYQYFGPATDEVRTFAVRFNGKRGSIQSCIDHRNKGFVRSLGWVVLLSLLWLPKLIIWRAGTWSIYESVPFVWGEGRGEETGVLLWV